MPPAVNRIAVALLAVLGLRRQPTALDEAPVGVVGVREAQDDAAHGTARGILRKAQFVARVDGPASPGGQFHVGYWIAAIAAFCAG